MNSAPSTSEMTPQRKRVGRPPKATQLKQSTEGAECTLTANQSIDADKSTSRVENESIKTVDGGIVALSPTPCIAQTESTNPRIAAAATNSNECRRSSRKKIIKFDVRDLLNKHRKPHKIQIEARIDSNAPQTIKPTTSPQITAGSNIISTAPAATSDLSSKQKAFMEKSAIFRRMSISDQQNKINVPILPPPLSSIPKIGVLGKNTINLKSNADTLTTIDPAKIAQARRLSRTQEIFNASLIKSKQNSSLIVAQIESNNASSSSGFMSPAVVVSQQQKKSTNVSNKRKNVSNSFASPTTVADAKSSPNELGVQKRRGRPPKNKIAIAQSTLAKTNLKPEFHITAEDKEENVHEQQLVEDKGVAHKDIPTSQSATNWTEYKANLKCETPSEVQKSIPTEKSYVQSEDVILEISSTSSISEHEYQPQTKTVKATKDVHESQQRNFASVCFWQDSQNVCEATSAPEFIVAAVEEITSENVPADRTLPSEPVGETFSQKSVEILTECEQSIAIDLDANKETEGESDSLSEMTLKMSSVSRKSSGSESESSSDRSNKSYKKGDKLRVSLKRLTLPQSAITSAISLSSASSSCSDVIAGSDNNSNINNNSGESSGTTITNTELNTVTTSKSLPTRRSHRFPKKIPDSEVTVGDSKTQTKISLNEKLDKVDKHKMTAGEEEQKSVLPIEDITTTALKTDICLEHTNEESENIAATTTENVTVDLITPQQVETSTVTVATVELSSEQTTEIPHEIQSTNSIVPEVAAELPIEQTNKIDKGIEHREHNKDISEDSPTVSCDTKKQHITLPLKKQVSKFKMYEAAVHNVVANVETSTLLDILNTVKQNDLTMGTKPTQQRVELVPAEIIAPKEGEENMPTTATVESRLEPLTEAGGLSDKSVTTLDLTDKLQATDQDSSTEPNEEPSKCVHTVKSRDEAETKEKLTWENVSQDESNNRMDLTIEECEISETVTECDYTTLPAEEIVIHTTFTDHSLEGLQTSTNEEANTAEAVREESKIILAKESQALTVSVTERTAANVLDESSSEEIISTTDSQSSRDEVSRNSATKTPSPTLSETSNGKPSKKPTRRNERRSKRGDNSGHKTLEETFAEIAAESSKAVLKLKAQEVDVDNEGLTAKVTERDVAESHISSQQDEFSKTVVPNKFTANATEDSTSVESSHVAVSTTEHKNFDEDEVPNVQNTIEVTTEEITIEVCKDSSAKGDSVVSKVVLLQDDTDSNSNHSSPSRRGRKTRNKKASNKPTTITSLITADSLGENKLETTEVNPADEPITAITNTTAECNIEISQPNLQSTIIEMIVKDSDNADVITETLEEEKTKESILDKVLEPEESDSTIITVDHTSDSHLAVSTACVENAETTNISNNATLDLSRDNIEENKDRIEQSTSKTRKHKKPTNSAIQQAEVVDLGAESEERQMEVCDQIDDVKPEEPYEQQAEKILQTSEELFQNKSENLDKNGTSTFKENSVVDSKVAADISTETVAQNVELPVQREQSVTPIDKPKKGRKRRVNKSDEKSNELETKDQNKSEDRESVETKEKSSDAEDTVGKTRKPRKEKPANEADNDIQSVVAVEVPNTAELIQKELAKAPPKKRLLKMQMEIEEKNCAPSSEIPSTSLASAEPKPSVSKKSANNSSKTKESTQKKTKKDTQSSDQIKKRESLESQIESSLDEESRSATSTPVAKRFKQQTPDDKTKSSGKRKSKVEQSISSNEKSEIKDRERKLSVSKKSEKKQFLAIEDTASNELAKKMEEKSAKKKRQKKLKEDFEAALKDALAKTIAPSEPVKKSVNPTENVDPALEEVKIQEIADINDVAAIIVEDKKNTVEEGQIVKTSESAANNELEEEPDPLKDIEKFIEDGVNLLKRGYKIDDDSVDEVICPKTNLQKDEQKLDVTENVEKPPSVTVEGMTTPHESLAGDITPIDKSFEDAANTLTQNIYYETPADTPVATPTTTPPPKSPIHDPAIDEITGVRRSHRIKQITKTPKALVGRGLVREKERFSIKDDVEMKTHYSLDDHLTDLAQVEAKNAKFLKEMEERLSNFHVIKDNEYKCERVVSREARKMLCDCFLTAEEEERGELGCGEDCLNRLLMIECGPDCNVKDRCTNKRFQKLLCSPCRVFRTEKKGFGIMADIEILPGEFIMEYVGEVIDGDEFEQRRTAYSLDKNRHYYFMALRSDAIIDATIKGNISRFINHSCDPNAETQKWTVNGELRIGFFSRKSIMPGEEITFDYQYQRYGREAQRCYCESANCRGWIGEEPNSDEGEQIDDDSDADNLADGSDDEDSDDSTTATGKSLISAEDGKTKSENKEKKKKVGDDEHRDADDDTKAKLKKLTGKSADKAPRKKKPNKEKKDKALRKSATGEQNKTSRYLEDPDIEDEVKFLSRGGLRNQSDTLRFSRLVVRAKLPQTRLNLLKILRNADLPCRRLFLDYHGLRLLHGWMSEDGGDMAIRLSLLEALESLPIANKTVLTDSKVYQSVRNWCGNALLAGSVPTANASSPSDESSKESTSSNSQQDIASVQEVPSELQKLALKLTAAWNSLPEIFRIPKRERIEQMKEHEREADRQFAEASVDTNRALISDRYQRDRFGRGPTTSRYSKPSFSKDGRNNNITVVGSMPSGDPRRRSAHDSNESMKHLSKEQRRELFAAKVARDEAEKRLAEERREFETKCRFFGLDPKKTRSQDVPFCVDPSTGQWYSVARQPIPTPPCYAHVQVQQKPKSTDPEDYKLPAVVATLPRQWKYAITTLGQIYYYHTKQKITQWHPPTLEQLHAAAEEADSSDSESCEEAKLANESSEDDDVLIGMDEAQLKAFIDKKVENRRHKRYSRLVDQRPISPRKEEDRIYNQIEMRKYKENKEKIRKRKEEIRRKRAEALKAAAMGGVDPNAVVESLNNELSKSKNGEDSDEPDGAIPIQDYLLSSDEEEIMKEECNNSPLLEKIVQGDKIVDELDALTTKRTLKRTLPPHRDANALPGQSSSGNSGGGSEHKRRKSEKKEKSKKGKDSDSKYRRNKEKFRCEIAGIIVQHLKPYRKESCTLGRIQSDEDFNHLARKLTHFVMVKELKYCESVGQTLVVTESVKNKSREFIKKYMAKYGGMYVKPANDPEFKEIPFTI